MLRKPVTHSHDIFKTTSLLHCWVGRVQARESSVIRFSAASWQTFLWEHGWLITPMRSERFRLYNKWHCTHTEPAEAWLRVFQTTGQCSSEAVCWQTTHVTSALWWEVLPGDPKFMCATASEWAKVDHELTCETCDQILSLNPECTYTFQYQVLCSSRC